MGQPVCLLVTRGTFITTAIIAILLIVRVAVASVEQAPQISEKGGAINCTNVASAAIHLYCNGNNEFEEFDPTADRLVLDFVETKVLNSDLHEGSNVSGRFYDVYQSTSYPMYLVYFNSHIYLDLTFERLTEYIEEKNEQLENYTFKSTNEGHDLVIADIAKFYTFMKSRGLPLNAAEAHLKRALMHAKILVQNSEGLYAEGVSGAVILALSRESQKEVLSHELNHGVYFTDSMYRQSIQTCWMELSADDKNLVKDMLTKITDGVLSLESDQSLFLREFAAYFRDLEALTRDYLDGTEIKYNIDKLLSIESKLQNIEKHIQFYQNRPP